MKIKKVQKPILTTNKITEKTTLGEVLQINGDAAEILFEEGLHCIMCPASYSESIKQGCRAHGMNKEEIDNLIKRLNN